MKGHPFLVAFTGLFVLGLIVKFWWVVALIGVGYCGYQACRWHQVDLAERRHRDQLTAARADWEHQQFQAGNSVGWYGQYPPAR